MQSIKEKVNYCLNCKANPCSVKGCPLNNNIPEFIRLVKIKNYKEAYKVLSQTTVLPGVCGIVCPHTKQCQGSCVRGIKGEPVAIGDIESFIFQKAVEEKYSLKDAFYDLENDKLKNLEETEKEKYKAKKIKLSNKKVAVVGGGPAGLTCAAFLAKTGVQVTIYEKYDYLGGLLVHGIPDFRLSRETIKETVNRILDLGIKVEYKKELEKNLKLDDLEKNYNEVFVAIGDNKSFKMEVQGEELEGVYGGNELLEYQNHPDYKNKIVAVVGGGNVAMDCSRTIIRMRSKTGQCYI